MSTFKIHPSIGIARLGDSTTEFYLCPDQAGVLPIDCTPDGKPIIGPDGKEQRVAKFKDAQNRIKRQAARFRVYVYDDAGAGHELQIGETIMIKNEHSGQKIEAEVLDVVWTVYLANKKACWYQFNTTQGEHGYLPDHPLRNADVTDPTLRQHLIIDPGPQTVGLAKALKKSAEFARGKNPNSVQSFPPPLIPSSIDTLGEIKVYEQDKSSRLIVLGGYGNSGTSKTGPGQPSTQTYANNEGWFDDTSDGPVTAQIQYKPLKIDGQKPIQTSPLLINVEDPAWCIVGYPRYAPEIVDVITMDDLVYDVSIRQFALNPLIYGAGLPVPTTPEELKSWRTRATWNPAFRPYFWRDIWPLLSRPQYYSWITDPGQMFGGDPHNATKGADGAFDPNEISVPPGADQDPAVIQKRAELRGKIFGVLRPPGGENDFRVANPRYPTRKFIGMPYLCGDNPLTNVAPSKFLRLTDTQLFFLKQWAEGKFVDEVAEKIDVTLPAGEALDRGALATMLGGAFCPGAEACWIMRNPAIYAKPYRIHVSKDYQPHYPYQNWVPGDLSLTGDLATGLEPGDLTKYGALPWQTDFNECSTQDINITYRDWNVTPLDSIGDPAQQVIQTTYWWPSHRPMWVPASPTKGPVFWANGIAQTNDGDLKMASGAWTTLGFVKQNQDAVKTPSNGQNLFYIVEAQNQ